MRIIFICLILKLLWCCSAKHACDVCTGSSQVELKNCSFSASSVQVLKQCSSLEVLLIELVALPTFHLSEQLREIRVENCSTSSVLIDPAGRYRIERIAVEKNDLRALPRNLNVLKQLRKLNLASNLIECIDMAEFIGLSKLEEIDLSDNRIIQICSSPLDPPVLPRLDRVYLQRNNLTTLNLENWKTPNVKLMYLNNNQLSVVNKLAQSLPRLESLYIYENPLNCEWWHSTKNVIMEHSSFSPNMLETCSPKAEPLHTFMKEIETSSKIQSTSTDQCQLKSSQSLAQILAQVQQLQQQVASLGPSTPTGTNETISQLQRTCFGQRTRIRRLATEMDSLLTRARTNPKSAARKDCRCGVRAQARLLQRQLRQLEDSFDSSG